MHNLCTCHLYQRKNTSPSFVEVGINLDAEPGPLTSIDLRTETTVRWVIHTQWYYYNSNYNNNKHIMHKSYIQILIQYFNNSNLSINITYPQFEFEHIMKLRFISTSHFTFQFTIQLFHFISVAHSINSFGLSFH